MRLSRIHPLVFLVALPLACAAMGWAEGNVRSGLVRGLVAGVLTAGASWFLRSRLHTQES